MGATSFPFSASRSRAAWPRAEKGGRGALLEISSVVAGTTVSGSSPADTTTACANSNQLARPEEVDRKSTRLNSSHVSISYAVFCLKKNRPNLAQLKKVLLS